MTSMIRFFKKRNVPQDTKFLVTLRMTVVRGDGIHEPRTRENVTESGTVLARDANAAMSKARNWYQQRQSASCKFIIHDAAAEPLAPDSESGSGFLLI